MGKGAWGLLAEDSSAQWANSAMREMGAHLVLLGKIQGPAGRLTSWNPLPRLRIWVCMIPGVFPEETGDEGGFEIHPHSSMRLPSSVHVLKLNLVGEAEVSQMSDYARRSWGQEGYEQRTLEHRGRSDQR